MWVKSLHDSHDAYTKEEEEEEEEMDKLVVVGEVEEA